MKKWLGCAVCALTMGAAPRAEAAGDAEPAIASLPARPAPEWVRRGVMYQIQPRAFTPEGTLKAAAARLPQVAALGVDILYLCPVFVSDDDPNTESWSPRQRASGMNNPRNPYRMKDYYHVDPEYGTDEDLKSFIAEAHRLQMRVLLDMVYLHCGPNAVFLDEHPDFVKRDAEGKIATAAWGFPAVNLDNPQLREYLWKNMEYWIEDFDVDGFRCDVAHGVPLGFWEAARERLEAVRPDVCMLAEAGTQRPADQVKAFDISYGFAWFEAIRSVNDKGAPAALLRETAEEQAAALPRGARFIRYVDNHDIANDCFNNRLEKAWGAQRIDVTLVANFTLDGVPFLYNGQEVADAARHSIFGRAPIDWANGQTPAGEARLALCRKLCAMRHTERALTHGSVAWLDNDQPDKILSFLRATPDEEIAVVLNFSDRAVDVHVEFPESAPGLWEPLLAHGAEVEEDDKGPVWRMEGLGYFVAKRH
ncbi:MAG: alpha-glucosidase C-terminal domain-containing protein [Candidatus Hydrogenedentes bacterium]|nr:alpha-glucosidase C-terminal domain-containing protein [Candidatus Hydrogenedentota bacterium]